jgi:magnesium-protoporphyrin O-methyltransferase
MLDDRLGGFDHVVAMDSLIYYDTATVAGVLDGLARRTTGSVVFTLAPRTALLMLMWRAGKLFPRADRSPVMVPQVPAQVAARLTAGMLREVERINAKFYISTALEVRPC